jgi:hypothetical protein
VTDAHKHAPRGRIKARDPIESPDPMKRQCTATNRQGKRCGKPPILGGTVCRMHGGAAPQVKLKAMERLMALQDPAITRLGELILDTTFPSTSFAAVRDVLDRTIGKPTENVNMQVSGELDIVARRLLEARARRVKSPAGGDSSLSLANS